MTKNLQNLVTQLQSMENSMISIMLDLATKLASLSDISFLLLIETQGKTKFTGSQHLTEAYLMSNLNDILDSEGPEVEMQFEKTPVPKVVLSRQKNDRRSGSRKKEALLKRRLGETNLNFDPTCETPVKKYKREAIDGEEVITLDDDAITSTRLDSSAYFVDSSLSRRDGDNQHLAIVDVDKNNYGRDDQNEYDDQNVGDEDESGGRRGRRMGDSLAVTHYLNGVDDDDDPSRRSFLSADDDALVVATASSSPAVATTSDGLHDSLLLRDWDVESFLESSEKLKYIRTIDCPSLVLDKESTEFKLLHSLIYELSKNAATFCPFHSSDARTSQFFANVFDNFWSRIPYLQQLQEERVLPGDKATSKYKNLKSLLRWKMQKNFGMLMRKYNIRSKISL